MIDAPMDADLKAHLDAWRQDLMDHLDRRFEEINHRIDTMDQHPLLRETRILDAVQAIARGEGEVPVTRTARSLSDQPILGTSGGVEQRP